ncbi:hypothetical protein C8R45DRAFT_1109539 [Mycena sanguinolenta]|nr:hypothetical protein C8R45DRAFT_1109539 [Mycena sanguinolenta]
MPASRLFIRPSLYATAQAGTPPKSTEDTEHLAGQVLVSVLAVPVGLAFSTEEPAKQRLTALLELTKPPMCAGVLRGTLAWDVLRCAPAPIKQLATLRQSWHSSVITFVDDPFVDMLDESHAATDNTGTGVVREEDGVVQLSVAELVCTHLGSVARCLYNVLEAIAPPPPARFTGSTAEARDVAS